MKLLSKLLFIAYVALLLWLVLFKLSFNPGLLFSVHERSFNIVPFANFSGNNAMGALYNLVAFIPLGVLLSSTTRLTFWPKFAVIVLLSMSVEATQYIFAIGITDITDVMTNTSGGFIGLGLYGVASCYISRATLDRYITIVGVGLFAVCFMLIGVMFSHGIRFVSGHHGARASQQRLQ